MCTGWKELPILGFKMPPDFPSEAYLLVNSDLEKYKSTHREQCKSFGLGWKGIAYRYRTSVEYDEQFTNSVIKYSNSPPHEERYYQEKFLTGFFANAISTLECFFFSTRCIASILKPEEFPMMADRDLRFYPSDVARDFNNYFSSDSISRKQTECLKDTHYEKMKDMRDVLIHRGMPSRSFYVGGDRNGMATMPDNIKGLSNQWQFDFPIDQQTTSSHRRWLSNMLKDLIEATDGFCKDNL